MRTERRAAPAAFAAALLAAAALTAASSARAQDSLPKGAEGEFPPDDAAGPSHDDEADEHGHGAKGATNLSDLTPEQRAVALDAWSHVLCNCPRENWSKTLLNCPDGCADPQKLEILQRVAAGWTRDAIVEEQVRLYGDQAAADPGGRINGSLLVLAGVVFGAGAAGIVLARWGREAEARRDAARTARTDAPPTADEIAVVEQELREIE